MRYTRNHYHDLIKKIKTDRNSAVLWATHYKVVKLENFGLRFIKFLKLKEKIVCGFNDSCTDEDIANSFAEQYELLYNSVTSSLSARILHRAPPRLQVDQNFLTQKIVADPKMRCHQKSFGIWRVTEAILGQKTCFFSKKHILEKIHNKSHYFFKF